MIMKKVIGNSCIGQLNLKVMNLTTILILILIGLMVGVPEAGINWFAHFFFDLFFFFSIFSSIRNLTIFSISFRGIGFPIGN